MTDPDGERPVDWARCTREGAIRQAMRRWAGLPLERILAAQEELAERPPRWARRPPARATTAADLPGARDPRAA